MRPKSIQISDLSEVQKLVALVNASGLKFAARAYDTNETTLWRWLKNQGYECNIVWALTPKGKEAVQNA
jgi:hypothetical protein